MPILAPGQRALAAGVCGIMLAVIAGCGSSAAGEDARSTLTVLAASSLTDAFGELAGEFERRNPGVEVRQSFESSATLLAQIQQGAPADVFAPASVEEMNAAVSDGLIRGDPRIFVENSEVVMVPEGSPAGIRRFGDLAKPGVRLVLAEEGVPASDYAMEILARASGEYGTDFQKDVLSNVVSREVDVRASVNRVVVGDADATIGYASDFTPDVRDRVDIVAVPHDMNIVAKYPIAVLEDAGDPELAAEWVGLVTAERGRRVLETWGFEPAG